MKRVFCTGKRWCFWLFFMHSLQNEIINISLEEKEKIEYIELLIEYMESYCSENEEKLWEMSSHILKLASFVFIEFLDYWYKLVNWVNQEKKDNLIKLLFDVWVFLSKIRSDFEKAEFIFSSLISNNLRVLPSWQNFNSVILALWKEKTL